MEVNHPEVCIFVLSKAQLLAIPLAKDNGWPIFVFGDNNSEKSQKKIEKSQKFENFDKINEN